MNLEVRGSTAIDDIVRSWNILSVPCNHFNSTTAAYFPNYLHGIGSWNISVVIQWTKSSKYQTKSPSSCVASATGDVTVWHFSLKPCSDPSTLPLQLKWAISLENPESAPRPLYESHVWDWGSWLVINPVTMCSFDSLCTGGRSLCVKAGTEPCAPPAVAWQFDRQKVQNTHLLIRG